MAFGKIMSSGLGAVRSHAAQHREFVTGVGQGIGGAVAYNAVRNAAAQLHMTFERYGDAFQKILLYASADLRSLVCAGLNRASAVTATGFAALLLRKFLISSGGSRGQMLEVPCRDTVRLRIFEGNRLLAMLQDEPNVFLACSDSVIMIVQEQLSHTAINRITAHPQEAVMQAQRWSRNQSLYIFGSMQRGSYSAVVHFWAQECTADKAKRLPILHVKAKQQSMVVLRRDSNLDGSPRLLLGIVRGPCSGACDDPVY